MALPNIYYDQVAQIEYRGEVVGRVAFVGDAPKPSQYSRRKVPR